MSKFFKDISALEQKAYTFVLVAVLLTVFFQTFHTFLSNTVGMFLSLLILVSGFGGWFLYYKTHSLNAWGKAFFALIVYFLIVGMLHGIRLSNHIIGLALSQDLRYVMFFIIGGMFAFDDKMYYFHQIMKVLGIISIIFGFFALLTFNPSLQSIDTREGTWSISYYYWWCSLACFYYWGYYALFMKKDIAIGYGVMIAYVLLGFLFLKRSVVVDFTTMLLFYVLFAPKKRGYFTPIAILSVIVLILLLFKGSFLNSIYDLLMGRFELSMEEFDRQLEANAYFSNASIFDLILGNGIGHYYNSVNIRDSASTLNALHLGWANIIYKGGVVYAIYSVLLYLSVVKCLIRLPKDNYGRVCLGVAVSSLVSLFYAGSWTYTILPFCISAPIFYTVTHRSGK